MFFLVTVGSHEKYQGVIFQMQSYVLSIFFPGVFVATFIYFEIIENHIL